LTDAVRPDGRVLFAGWENLTSPTASATAALAVTQLNPDGSPDIGFNGNGQASLQELTGPANGYGTAATVLSNGLVVVLGSVVFADETQPNAYDNSSDATVFWYQRDGSLAASAANLGPHSTPLDLVAGPNNTVVITAVQDGHFVVARYRADGTPDPNFGTNGVVQVGVDFIPNGNGWFGSMVGHTLAVQPDGKILLTGGLFDGGTEVTLLRLNCNGMRDTSFGTSGNGEVVTDFGTGDVTGNGVAIQTVETTNYVVVVGLGGTLARYTLSGSLDTSFGTNGVVAPSGAIFSHRIATSGFYNDDIPTPPASVLIRPSGQIVVVGTAVVPNYSTASFGFALVQYTASGTRDTSFGTDGVTEFGVGIPPDGWDPLESNGFVVAMEGDGHVILASGGKLVRFTSDGELDTTFGVGGVQESSDFGFSAADVAPSPDGWIIAMAAYGIALVRFTPITTAGLQGILDSQPPVDPTTGDPTVTLQGNTQAQADAFVALFQDPGAPNFTPLHPPAGATRPIDVEVTFGPGVQFNEAALVIPQGIRVQINGGTWYGGSPALTFSSGDLTITGATFVNSTNAPTILVTGGHLTLRNDVIQESTGYNQVAISFTGGTVDLGTAASPGGNTINLNGPGAFAQNTTTTPIPAVGDAFTVNDAPLTPSSLSGIVWEDFNNDGQVDFGEKGIAGVTITLTGTDDLGNPINVTQTTDADGAYVFLNLRPGNYYLTETPPAGYTQGIDTVGTAGGSLSATDQFLIPLGPQVNGLNYNFGEQPAATGSVKKGQAAGIGFWNNTKGQALIKALPVVTNADGSVTSLANWLAATLPHMFGVYAGSNNLAGQSNAYVAALFQQDFVLKGVKLDAQVLATALNVYATNATLDSTKVAAPYGFTVSGDGLGAAAVSIGGDGDAFGVANNTTMTVMDLLVATDAQSVNGVLYNGNATKRSHAYDVYTAINQAGGL
jgi:uncharacterized delta-60 repeat protein